jgi:hypothetical protein
MLFLGFFFIGISACRGTRKNELTLDRAIHLAWEKSNQVSLANTKVTTKKQELQAVKNNQYQILKLLVSTSD